MADSLRPGPTMIDPDALHSCIALMARLRAPDGCPWDREQTFESIQRHTLEETYEVFDAIDRKNWPDLQDELGDLLLQVLFYSQMASEMGYFTIYDVAAGLSAKLIRRHPHIFADVHAPDSATVLRNWEEIKKSERASAVPAPQPGTLDAVPRFLPAILEACRLGAQAAKVGFDWPDPEGVFAKLHEEIAEVRAEITRDETSTVPPRSAEPTPALQQEIGDLLFTVIHLARHLKVDPESALRGTNARFRHRFSLMEMAAGDPQSLAGLDAAGQDALWRSAKESPAPLSNP